MIINSVGNSPQKGSDKVAPEAVSKLEAMMRKEISDAEQKISKQVASQIQN